MKLFKDTDSSPLMINTHAHFLPFDLESDKWTIVDNLLDAEIIPILIQWEKETIQLQINYIAPYYNGQLIVLLSLWHVEEFQTDEFEKMVLEHWNKLTDNVIVINTNISTNKIFYDFLWNRQKIYFINDKEIDLNFRVWENIYRREVYPVGNITPKQIVKKFLALIRVYSDNSPRSIFRKKLREFLLNYQTDGYLTVENNEILTEEDTVSNAGQFRPAKHTYYVNSFISIYTETLTTSKSDIRSITEKTWTPLIKGHFILPFGYPGLITDLREYGFILPQWIDYSYDNIKDDDERFELYKKSIIKILSKSNEELQYLHNSNLDMLKFNKSIFYTKSYDSLYEKIKNAKKT